MARKITYWVSAGLLAAMSLFAGYAYLSGSPQAVQGFAHVGYPQQLRIILGIAKPLGAIALLVPGIARVKEWAYAGFAIAWICAFIAHYLAFRSAGIAGATGRLLFDPPCEPALSRYGHTELDVDRLSGRAWRWLQRCSFFG